MQKYHKIDYVQSGPSKASYLAPQPNFFWLLSRIFQPASAEKWLLSRIFWLLSRIFWLLSRVFWLLSRIFFFCSSAGFGSSAGFFDFGSSAEFFILAPLPNFFFLLPYQILRLIVLRTPPLNCSYGLKATINFNLAVHTALMG